MPLKLGFLGSGAITSAMVTGLCSGEGEQHAIVLSPRNAAIAADLSHRFPQVSVAGSNQEVVDGCETVVLAVRPQIAAAVLSEVRFRAEHTVISLISGFPVRRLSGLVAPASRITRAVPLPTAARRRSPTAIYPDSAIAAALFASLGAAFAVDTESDFDAVCTVTATMASYFAFADTIAAWLARHGIPEARARDYVAQVFSGLAHTAVDAPERTFPELAADHATKGGTNEQVLAQLRQSGAYDALSNALDAVMVRVTAGAK